MYDDLVKRLRDISNSDSNIKSNYIGFTMLQAADAIEALNDTSQAQDKALKNIAGQLARRWISVTERLPEKGLTILDTTFSVDVLGFDGWDYRRAYYNYTAKVWLNGNDKQEWPEITHWMPISKDGLPEPPNEEI